MWARSHLYRGALLQLFLVYLMTDGGSAAGAQGEGSTAYWMGGNSLAYSYATTHAADPNR